MWKSLIKSLTCIRNEGVTKREGSSLRAKAHLVCDFTRFWFTLRCTEPASPVCALRSPRGWRASVGLLRSPATRLPCGSVVKTCRRRARRTQVRRHSDVPLGSTLPRIYGQLWRVCYETSSKMFSQAVFYGCCGRAGASTQRKNQDEEIA